MALSCLSVPAWRKDGQLRKDGYSPEFASGRECGGRWTCRRRPWVDKRGGSAGGGDSFFGAVGFNLGDLSSAVAYVFSVVRRRPPYLARPDNTLEKLGSQRNVCRK